MYVERMARRKFRRYIKKDLRLNEDLYQLSLETSPNYDAIKKMIEKWYNRGGITAHERKEINLAVMRENADELREICHRWVKKARRKHQYDHIQDAFEELFVLEQLRILALWEGSDAEDLEYDLLDKIQKLKDLIYQEGLEELFSEELPAIDNLKADACIGVEQMNALTDQFKKLYDLEGLLDCLDEDPDNRELAKILLENLEGAGNLMNTVKGLMDTFNPEGLSGKLLKDTNDLTTLVKEWEDLSKPMNDLKKMMDLDE